MHIKRFIGQTAKDAMGRVKSEFGANALIFGTRRLENGLTEVTAAFDFEAMKTAGERSVASPATRSHETDEALRHKAVHDDPMGAVLKKEIEELRELKEILRSCIPASRESAGASARLESELVSNGIDRRLAKKMVDSALKNIVPEKADDAGFLRRFMKERVSRKLGVSNPLGERAVLAFVGPAGVGKTTTIAKLAAVERLKKRKSVSLITMDTYRIGAVEQLKEYAGIIGVDVAVASTPAELTRQISHSRDKDVVLIDTAGRSHKDRGRLKELSDISAINPGVKFNLVLSAETRDEALYDCVRGYEPVPVGSLTFTRLDEACVYGPILNTMVLAGKPLAYLSSGQRVPEDIELATTERLKEFFMPN